MFKDRLLWSGILFAGGVAAVQQLSSLPSPYWLLLFPPVAGLCWWRPRFVVVCALFSGLAWALLWAQLRLDDALPSELIGRDIDVTGSVVSIPEHDSQRTRFDFRIEQADEKNLPLPLKVRLSWYWRQGAGPPAVAVGQQWHLQLRLKPPVGFMNPGGFDYEGWLFSRNIRASGYVREQGDNRILKSWQPGYAVSILRSKLLNNLRELTAGLPHRGILLALILGYRGDITDQDWEVLLHTGTNHLMAISGLHIGLVAGLLYALVLWCTRRVYARPWCRRDLWPAQRVAALAAWGGAVLYAMLAGFALPAQRAVIMLTVGLYAIIAYRQLRPAQALSLALIAVLLFDPFAVNSAGFWLSFSAVAVLIYCYAGRRREGGKRLTGFLLRWGNVQRVLLIGLLPLTVFWFGAAAVTAAAANLVAIPLVGLLIVPMLLLSALFCALYAPVAQLLLQASDALLGWLWPLLEWMQALPLSRWEQPEPPLWAVVLALAGAALLLAPRAFPARWVGLFWFAPLVFYAPPRPLPGELWVSALDVGQGTAVVVQTPNHTLIYDTGPKFSERFDSGTMVVLPFLKHYGIRRADMLLVSHGDNDHSGGSGSIIQALPVGRIVGNVSRQLTPRPVESCRDGQHWEWDGVRFSVLHPDRSARWTGNNSSCVLLIENGDSRILLTGDIEKHAERHLLNEHHIQPLRVLLAPHHGSRSSSTQAFVDAVQPEYVVFTAGLFNRYGFPDADVAGRYRDTGARLLSTGEQGAMRFVVTGNQAELAYSYRSSARRYWHYAALPAAN